MVAGARSGGVNTADRSVNYITFFIYIEAQFIYLVAFEALDPWSVQCRYP